MSFDLYVFDRDVPADPDELMELLEQEGDDEPDLSPRLQELVDLLVDKHPGLDGDDPDASPWASWPLDQPVAGGQGNAFNIVWSRADELSAELRELSGKLGLVLYDPQEDEVVRPG